MRIVRPELGRRVSASVLGLVMLTALGAGSAYAEGGQEIFELNCAVCHGLDGTPVLPNAPHFAKGERLEKTDEELLVSLTDGLNVMPPWKSVLNEDQMKEVLIYVRSLAE
jgi:mono/diheme cytochrome c family protein